uniref:Thrombospondin type 1 domain-containing protein,putative n=1 Tax=Neospora caninum (strain Liverpool) TaxID=572307 RepID=A0A0F7UL56_NEOCL|nr:TPA: thrombospondin type 1 domain-containing protein,putative [Neospora caninum Liverpool]
MGVFSVQPFRLRTPMVFTATRAPSLLYLVAAFVAALFLRGVTSQLQLGVTELTSTRWTTIQFEEPMIDPIVFTSPPETAGNGFALVLLGAVTNSGFRARVYFPSCSRASNIGASYSVRWLAVDLTSAGYYDRSNKRTIDWTAHKLTLAAPGTIPAGHVWSTSFAAWQDRPGTPGVLVGVQNHREMINALYSSAEYLNPVVINGKSGGSLMFSFPNQISYRSGFSLKVGVFQYDAMPGATIGGVNLVAERYEFRVNEKLPVADVVADGTIPATFAVQWATSNEAPLALVLTPESVPDGTDRESLVAVEDCRAAATYELHRFDITHAFTVQRINGGPNCFRQSASVPSALTEPCKLACKALWNAKSNEFWGCQDVNDCFENAFRSDETIKALPEVDASIAKGIVTSCIFETRSADLKQQYEHSVNLNVDEIVAGTTWSTSSHCGGEKLEAQIVGAFYAKEGVSILTASPCEVQDVSKDTEKLCAEQSGVGCSMSSAQIDQLTQTYQGLCFAPEDATLHIFFNCTYDATAPFDCELYESGGFDSESGACMCPKALTPCSLEEGSFRSSWLQNLNRSYQYTLRDHIRYMPKHSVFQAYDAMNAGGQSLCAATNTIAVCKNPTPAAALSGNKGPNCYIVERGVDYCRLPCLEAWGAFVATNDVSELSDCQSEFERFWLSFNFPAIPSLTSSSFLDQLDYCRFATRPATAPLQQYEDEIDVYLPDFGTVLIRLVCDSLYVPEVVQALIGPASTLLSSVHEPGCRYEDVTETVRKACQNDWSRGATTCAIDVSLFTPKEILCSTSTVKLVVRGNCIPGPSLPTDYTCVPYRTTGTVARNGKSCSCPNSANPCTHEEGRLTASTWQSEFKSGVTVSLADRVIWTAPPGTRDYAYTHTDAQDYVCSANEHHFVLCKDRMPQEVTTSSRNPHCLRGFSSQPAATTVDDRDCQDACASLFATSCAQAKNRWLCVAQALPKCYIPNTDSFTCQVDTNPSVYSTSYGACSCSGTYSPCSAEEAEVTKHDWLTAFTALSGRKGVVVARGKQALWIGNPDKWRYENGMNQGSGCLNNPWFVGVFCGARLSVTPPARGDALPVCAGAAMTADPGSPHPLCRVTCSKLLEECKKLLSSDGGESSYPSVFGCFTDRAKGTVLDRCTYDLGTEDREPGAAELHTGWTVATASWSRVLFGVEFTEPPVVFLGVARNTQPFYNPVVRSVTKTSFEVKLYRDNCGSADTRSTSAPVSWMAIPEGVYVTEYVENPIRVVSLPLTTRSPTVLTVSLSGVKAPEEVVALAQLQDVSPNTVSTGRIAVAISNLKSNSLELSLLMDDSVSFSSVTVGILVSGKQHPDLAAGLYPVLNRSYLETFRIPGDKYAATSILGEGLFFAGKYMPHVFASVIHTRSRDQQLEESDQVVISRRATTTAFTWSALLWNKTCQTKRLFEAVQDATGLLIAGLYLESRTPEPSAILANRQDICLAFIGQNYENGLVRACTDACRNALPSSLDQHCVHECRSSIFAPGVNEACMTDCARKVEAQFEDCAGQCSIESTESCHRKCKEFLGNKCEGVSLADVEACLEYSTPVAFFEECILVITYSSKEGTVSEGFESETETVPDQTYDDCVVVDMQDPRFATSVGWDSRVASCKCPNGYRACTSETVNAQRHWRTNLRLPGGLCEAQPNGAFNPVTQHLWSTTDDLCALAADATEPAITWSSNRLPAYADQDINLGTSIARGGEYQCSKKWHYIFCPAQATSTTTQAPPPADFTTTLETAIVGEWGEWSACTGTCRSQGWTPKRTRTRVVLTELPESKIPSLSETGACFDLPECNTVCWDREWTEWSDCKLFTTVMGQGLEYYRQQIRPIFDFVEDACGAEERVRFAKCGDANDSVEQRDSRITRRTDSPWAASYLAVLSQSEGRSASRRSRALTQASSPFYAAYETRSPSSPVSTQVERTQKRRGFMQWQRSVTRSGGLEEDSDAQRGRRDVDEQGGAAIQRETRRPQATGKQRSGVDIAYTDADASTSARAGDIYGSASNRSNVEATFNGPETPAHGWAQIGSASRSSEAAAGTSQDRAAGAGADLLRTQLSTGVTVDAGNLSGVQDHDRACSTVSEWSGCDSPCLPHKGATPRRYQLALPGQNQAHYCTVQHVGHEHLCTNLPVCAHPTFDCSKVTASRMTDEDMAACKTVCEEVLAVCDSMMNVPFALYTSLEQCALVHFDEYEQYPGQCHIPSEFTSTRQPSTCFPSRTRRRVASGELPFIFQLSASTSSKVSPSETLDSSPSFSASFVSMGTLAAPSSRIRNALDFEAAASGRYIDSCECLSPEDEPCTAQEARDSLFDSLYLFLTHPLCADSPGAEEAFFNSTHPNQTADATSYFAVRGLGRMHCPVPMYKSSVQVKSVLTPKRVTFSEFKTKQELNEFCHKGLSTWRANTPDELLGSVNIPNCELVTQRRDVESHADCKLLCSKIMSSCSAASLSFVEMSQCIKDKLNQSNFYSNCSTPEVLAPGEGLILCKKKVSTCDYTEWSEWSTCTATCFDWDAGSVPLRVRARELESSSPETRTSCRVDSENDLVETEKCTWMPTCPDAEGEDMPDVLEPRKEPTVGPWSPERHLDDNNQAMGSDELVQGVVKCYLTDMSTLINSGSRGYNAQYRTCNCPSGRRPCSRAEALASLDYWTKETEALCQRGMTTVIAVAHSQAFSCVTRSFEELDISWTDSACTSSQYEYVLCEGVPYEGITTLTTWLICVLLGMGGGVCFVLFCLQYSSDLQKLVGLAGSYPVLVQNVTELQARENHILRRQVAIASHEDLSEPDSPWHSGTAWTGDVALPGRSAFLDDPWRSEEGAEPLLGIGNSAVLSPRHAECSGASQAPAMNRIRTPRASIVARRSTERRLAELGSERE